MRGDPHYAAVMAGAAFGGLALGGLFAAGASWWRGRLVTLGDLSDVLPRTPRERRWCLLVAINAGVSEELFFRLALPLLLVLVGLPAWAAAALALGAFAMAHRYQGITGVAGTLVFGAVAFALYLASGRLWLAILLHAAVDLNGLVVQPWLHATLPPRRAR